MLIDYLKKLESEPIVFSVKRIEMTLDEEISKTPLVTIIFSTFISDRPVKTQEEEKKPVISMPSASPFKSESRPYDNTMPGDHRLTMVIWKGGKRTALIDGKLMKEGAVLENKKLDKIESDGVWFIEDGTRYFLALEKR
jgi:hypothetical protein